MNTTDKYEYKVSEYLICALINGDVTGLTDKEDDLLTEFEQEAIANAKSGGFKSWAWSVDSEEPEFARCEVLGLLSSVCDLSLVVWK